MIYFDNAATSFPKPASTLEAMANYLTKVGASPGRSGHRASVEASRIVYEARELVAKLFNISDPLRIVFTKNATEAINTVLLGMLKPGDHVVTSSMEHNSVMRPLRYLSRRGVEVSVVSCTESGVLDPRRVREAIGPQTKLVALTHASNVTGTILPIEEVGEVLRSYPSIGFLVDAAQTAGTTAIDVEAMKIDFLAFTGHKSLFGPPGTGGLFIREGWEEQIEPLERGGTGSRSEWEEQPAFMPDKFEAGTLNTLGIAGLKAGVDFVLHEGVEKIRKKERILTERFLSGLEAFDEDVKIYGAREEKDKIALVSFNISGLSPSYVAQVLDENWAIMCRPGLHCAPSAHRTIGSFPVGTVRFSFGYFNTEEEIDLALEALKSLIKKRDKGA